MITGTLQRPWARPASEADLPSCKIEVYVELLTMLHRSVYSQSVHLLEGLCV